MDFIKELPARSRVLIVSNDCGGGHIQAEKRVRAEIEMRSRNVALDILPTMEIYKDSLGETIGNKVIQNWSEKQQTEDVVAINNFLNYQWVDNWLLWIISFFVFLVLLLKNDVTHVVSVQPIGIKAMIRAARVINFFRRIFHPKKPQIKIDLVLTELPTKHAQNFAGFTKNLTSNDRAILRLITTRPLVEKRESEDGFWEEHYGLSLEQGEVVYDRLPVMASFEKWSKVDKREIRELSVKVATPQERTQIEACCGNKEALPVFLPHTNKLRFHLQEQDQVDFILLGGNACNEATKEYVQQKGKAAKQDPSNVAQKFLFVFCSNNETLFQQLCDLVQEGKTKGDFPQNFHVIPLSRQDGAEIAPIFRKAHDSITKTGGLTSAQLHLMQPDRIFIHSAYKGAPEEATLEKLLFEGMPKWEAGNAQYLQKFNGAQIVTPQTIASHLTTAK